jgi:hypothetical protein
MPGEVLLSQQTLAPSSKASRDDYTQCSGSGNRLSAPELEANHEKSSMWVTWFALEQLLVNGLELT